MIRIAVIRDREGRITGFSIKGHAGQAPEGNDIVCAAVSAVAYAAVGALEELAGVSAGDRIEKDGHMEFGVGENLDRGNREKAAVILGTAEVGFRQIAHSYSKYVKIGKERNYR